MLLNPLRIEVTDTTSWFGFKDDVVVRLTPAPVGCRIDFRSVSRMGQSDVGSNARRIKAYIARLKKPGSDTHLTVAIRAPAINC
jgi:uncharacterized protein (DUF1499 family)